jgi:hypothetical protein
MLYVLVARKVQVVSDGYLTGVPLQIASDIGYIETSECDDGGTNAPCDSQEVRQTKM